MIILTCPRHKYFRPHDLLLKQTVKNKRIDRSIARYESAKVAPQVIVVLTGENIPEEILADVFVLSTIQAVMSSPARIKNRSVIRQLVKTKHVGTCPLICLH